MQNLHLIGLEHLQLEFYLDFNIITLKNLYKIFAFLNRCNLS